MRILSLHLHHFGAVTDERLEFSDGLNVVSGPNEAGKSTWHAAATLLLTGFPKSLRSKAIKPLYDRYRPWTGTEYKISGVVELDDGRRLRIVRDFNRRTSEIHEESRGPLPVAITTDASLDLAELVGLDRTTMPLVASVRQTEVLELARSASSKEGAALRDFLQRSLACRAESDVTAEAAIEAIERFRSAHIGTNKQGSNKPMRRAVEAMQAADASYRHGADQWEQYRQRERELAADIDRHNALEATIAAARVDAIREERERLARRINEVVSLDAELADPVDPALVPSDELLDHARQLWTRRSVFEERPCDIGAVVERREQLRAEIAELPTEIEPGPDTVPAAVTAARTDLEDARRVCEIIGRDQPTLDPSAAPVDADPQLIRRVAEELETPPPVIDATLRRRRDELEQRSSDDRRRATRTMVVATVLMVAAVVCVALGSIGALSAGFVLLGGAAIATWRSLQIRQRIGVQLSTVAEMQRRLAIEGEQIQAAQARRLDLEAMVAQWGCRPTPSELRRVAVHAEQDRAQRDLMRRWNAQHLAANDRLDAATARLVVALGAHGYGPGEERDANAVLEAADRLEADVARRRQGQSALRRRQELISQCALLDEAAESAERAERKIAAYEHALASFLTQVGITGSGGSIDDQLASLEDWLGKGRERRARCDAQQRLRERRDALCADGGLGRLRDALSELDAELAQHRRSQTQSDREGNEEWAPTPRGEVDFAELQSQHREIGERIHRGRGALHELSAQLTGLAELAEQRAKAHEQYERIRRQEELLDAARNHLSAARSKVHSAIAPQLVRATADRLALVTAGRYKRIDINPDDLSVHVEVEAGTWHDSSRLSFGTVEQIYLLLRAAIAEIVAPEAETCPLLLDDATVHADEGRTEALVDVLDDLGQERQVIVFSQEPVVRTSGSSRGATVIDLAA